MNKLQVRMARMAVVGFFLLVAVVGALYATSTDPAPKPAVFGEGFEGITETFTVALGASTGVTTITLEQTNIKEMYLWCPTLDSGDTATLAMTIVPFSSNADTDIAKATVVPNGWTTKAIGATDDGAVVKVFSSSTNIYTDGPVVLTLTTASTQAALRTFYVLFVREY